MSPKRATTPMVTTKARARRTSVASDEAGWTSDGIRRWRVPRSAARLGVERRGERRILLTEGPLEGGGEGCTGGHLGEEGTDSLLALALDDALHGVAGRPGFVVWRAN